MPVCLILQPIHASGVRKLQEAGISVRYASSADMHTVSREIPGCHAVITRNAGLNAAAIKAGRQLAVIANHGSGTNKVDVACASSLGIPVVYTPFANARSVAEHTVMLMLAVAKRLLRSDEAVRKDNWDYRYQGGLQVLQGKTLGVVGFGSIGRMVTEIAARGFGMNVLVYSPSVPDANISDSDASPCRNLHTLLSSADVVSLHRPSRPDTYRMIDTRALSCMKHTAILINTSRADLIDTDALISALQTGRIAGAGLDVFDQEPLAKDHPLCRLGNVLLTPHTAGSADEALKATADQCADQVIDVLSDRRPAHMVDVQVWERRRLVVLGEA